MGKAKYTAVYERDPDAAVWLVRIPSVQGCHTYGRTLAAARRHIREALEACTGDHADATAEIADDIRLGDLAHPVAKAIEGRAAADTAAIKAQDSVRDAVRRLDAAGVSQRDAAELLAVSFQRIGAISRAPKPRRAFSSTRPGRQRGTSR